MSPVKKPAAKPKTSKRTAAVAKKPAKAKLPKRAPVAVKKPAAKPKIPKRASAVAKKPAIAAKVAQSSPQERQIRRVRSERRKLEKQLVSAVKEIGVLRQYELRVSVLERELAERDALIASIRESQLPSVTSSEGEPPRG